MIAAPVADVVHTSQVPRRVIAPLVPGWVVVDGLPMYHRSCAGAAAEPGRAIVHVHGFGISGSYLEPTAARLAPRYPTFVPDLPGMGRSIRPERPFDLPALARALMHYCDAVGVERATFVGNSLGCPIIVEVASSFPDRIERAVLVSPAGGPNNQPIPRALGQMMLDGPREPVTMIPIAVRDYLRFGVLQSWSLFKSMNAYPTLERLANLLMPTLVIAGTRDPLINFGRVGVFAGLPHVDAVKIEGAHALNFSRPEIVAALIEAHVEGRPLVPPAGSTATVERVEVPAVWDGADA
ncbi:MAG TPA: alpha/beta hydrolase [Ilumatobacteraceae bacterium]